MKKFFMIIALIGAFIPAVQGLPAEVEEKYEIVSSRKKCEALKELIQSADAIEFKNWYTFSLPPKFLRELEQAVVETRKATRFELSAMGTGNTSLFTITQGLLEYCVAGVALKYAYDNYFHNDFAGIKICMEIVIAFLGVHYGSEAILTGLKYKQHLQSKLENLDAIAAHIAYEKSQGYCAPTAVEVMVAQPAPVKEPVSACRGK